MGRFTRIATIQTAEIEEFSTTIGTNNIVVVIITTATSKCYNSAVEKLLCCLLTETGKPIGSLDSGGKQTRRAKLVRPPMCRRDFRST
jgi:hypothetical protein